MCRDAHATMCSGTHALKQGSDNQYASLQNPFMAIILEEFERIINWCKRQLKVTGCNFVTYGMELIIINPFSAIFP